MHSASGSSEQERRQPAVMAPRGAVQWHPGGLAVRGSRQLALHTPCLPGLQVAHVLPAGFLLQGRGWGGLRLSNHLWFRCGLELASFTGSVPPTLSAPPHQRELPGRGRIESLGGTGQRC